ncbi:hypothetical protein B7463_g12554, partial [Scytalidium lignicola]
MLCQIANKKRKDQKAAWVAWCKKEALRKKAIKQLPRNVIEVLKLYKEYTPPPFIEPGKELIDQKPSITPPTDLADIPFHRPPQMLIQQLIRTNFAKPEPLEELQQEEVVEEGGVSDALMESYIRLDLEGEIGYSSSNFSDSGDSLDSEELDESGYVKLWLYLRTIEFLSVERPLLYSLLPGSADRINERSTPVHKVGQVHTPHLDDMLNEQQLFAISVTERVCSAVSLISASTTVVTFLSRSAFRKPINRLIFYALWGNIVLNVATLISRSGLQHGTGSSLCQFQAFLVQWFFPADTLWALCIACNVYLRFFYRYNSEQLRRLEWRYVLLCYSLPFIPAFTLLFIQTPGRGRVYGSAVFECWISLPWDTLRIAVLYGPVWLTIVVTFAIYVRVGLYIYSQIKQRRALGMTGDWIEDVSRIADTSTTERYVMRPAPSCPYQDHSQADESGTLRQETVSERSINRHSGASELIRVPSSINRLSTLIDPRYLSFGLNYAAAFVIPLQGFWNSIIFITISRREFKALFGQLHDSIALRVRTTMVLPRVQKTIESHGETVEALSAEDYFEGVGGPGVAQDGVGLVGVFGAGGKGDEHCLGDLLRATMDFDGYRGAAETPLDVLAVVDAMTGDIGSMDEEG